jgi:hypothetical protein
MAKNDIIPELSTHISQKVLYKTSLVIYTLSKLNSRFTRFRWKNGELPSLKPIVFLKHLCYSMGGNETEARDDRNG